MMSGQDGEEGAATGEMVENSGEPIAAPPPAIERVAEHAEPAHIAPESTGGHAVDAAHEPYEPHRLDLNEDDRLPWLESGEGEHGYEAVSSLRVFGAALGGLALLAAVVGAIWVGTHHQTAKPAPADGSVIAAASEPYKQAPANPGDKKFAGTGDSSFAVSQGQNRPAQLAAGSDKAGGNDKAGGRGAAADGAAAEAAAKDATGAPFAHAPAAAKPATADDSAGNAGVVQISAYSTATAAEAGWSRVSQHYDVLAGMKHRVVEGQADIGTVYRLQVLTAAGGGGAFCDKLKAAGLDCRVKH